MTFPGGEVEGLGEVAHADLVGHGQTVDDGDTRGVGERLETRGKLVALGRGERFRLRAAADRREDGD